jgi:HK97 gp10 family phage protein
VAMPKSVTKVRKDGIEFVSSVDRVQYTIMELSRAALRDTAKLLRNRIKSMAPVDTGNLRRNVGSWVRKAEDSDVPYLQVGVYDKERARKKGLQDAYYATWQEFGNSRHPAANGNRGFIRPAVQDSIEDIRRIQGQYLSEVENENKALGLIDEEEEVADD